jgi:hypothetical protein
MFNHKQKYNLSERVSQQKLLQFILRAQQIAQQDPHQDSGYAMVIVSIVTIVMFSMMGAYLLVANITKSSTNAYVDGTNTFYAAESGLNKRADQLRQRFVGYAVPSGLSPGQVTKADSVTPGNISNCFPVAISTAISNTDNDFECRNYAFKYNNNSAIVSGSGGTTQATDVSKQIDYTAFTFVADKTTYDPTSGVAAPVRTTISSGQPYAGLNAQQYRYTIYSIAAKVDPTNSASSLQRGDAQTVLQMDFKSQIIPLFQFAAFYAQDLEINSTTPMSVTGRIHTNANLYVQPIPITSLGIVDTEFLNEITVAGSIYNRVDAQPTTQNGKTRVLIGRSPNTYEYFPDYGTIGTSPLAATDISKFGGRVANANNGVVPLNPPEPSVLRKRNYHTGQIGAYYSKADLRLEMTPARAIPFNFTAIQSGVNAQGGTCTTAFTPGQDPPANYIDSARQGSNFKCTQFNLGQITSLQQPVLVLTRDSSEEEAKFCELPTDGSTDRHRNILNYAAVTADPTTVGLGAAKIDKVLRALQVAISAARMPMDYENVTSTGKLESDVRSTFATLLADSTLNIDLTAAQIDTISKASPASIAKARRSCFLPAPIQVIAKNHGYNGNTPPTSPEIYVPYVPPVVGPSAEPPAPPATPSATPPVISLLLDAIGIKAANAATLNGDANGMYDWREYRWIRAVQTNIESLTVWNRDGRFVTLAATDLTAPATATDLTTALNSSDPTIASTYPPAADTASANGLLFVRAPIDSTAPIRSFDHLGLAASDTTEAGMVLYASVNDFLDGSTTRTTPGTQDVKGDSTQKIYKLDANYNPVIDPATGSAIILDYYRTYPSSSGTKKRSPYAFAFNGGKNLPAPMTVASDQAIYLQGDYNTITKKPAAVMADTITVLSVNCLSPNTEKDPSKIPTAEINCAMNPYPYIYDGKTDKSPWTNLPTKSTLGVMYGAKTTSVNAAFLSFTNQSWGNLGLNRGYEYGSYYSGGLNNYMRLLEDWSDQTLNYSGSMVSLGTPLEFNGDYRSAGYSESYFNAPNRKFNYETDFNSFPKLPPLTPSVVYLQQDVFRRN